MIVLPALIVIVKQKCFFYLVTFSKTYIVTLASDIRDPGKALGKDKGRG